MSAPQVPPASDPVRSLDLAAILSRALASAIDPTAPTGAAAPPAFSQGGTLADVAARVAGQGVSLDRLLASDALKPFISVLFPGHFQDAAKCRHPWPHRQAGLRLRREPPADGLRGLPQGQGRR